VSCLQSCRALTTLALAGTNVTNAGIRGLELIPTLGSLSFSACKAITDVSCLQSCRALWNLDLGRTNVTNAGIKGLELISTLQKLNIEGCEVIGARPSWLPGVPLKTTPV
jgi:hypothetical protein